MTEQKKLTVLQVLPALESGGVERGTLEVGKHLVEHGHRSIVMSAGGRMVEQRLREGSEHVRWDIGRKCLWTLRLMSLVSTVVSGLGVGWGLGSGFGLGLGLVLRIG